MDPTVRGSDEEPSEELPKLSAAEFRAYNRFAEQMDAFHNHFRQTWNELYDAASNGKRPQNLTLPQLIALGLDFCHWLSTHHSIEERYFFPLLARKMPAFREELELLAQHKQIHAGLDKFEAYLNECKAGESELRLDRMKELMDGFGTVLWQHLDDEVTELGAENMRKYWTLEELRAFPM
ncbi:MAG: hypothetical protein M1839_003374 [Geoglossum umbratile]|nr:MAG: hypothetical protein M1839_003374 [Geoglossum umbratile]